MKLYFKGDNAVRELVDDNIVNEADAANAILKHQKRFFVVPKRVKIKTEASKTTFSNSDGKDLGYSLEND